MKPSILGSGGAPPGALGGGTGAMMRPPRMHPDVEATYNAVKRARQDFESPPPCCSSPMVFATDVMIAGRSMQEAKVCRWCGSWRLSTSACWAGLVPEPGFSYPDDSGMAVPDCAGVWPERDRDALRAIGRDLRHLDVEAAKAVEHEADRAISSRKERSARALILLKLALADQGIERVAANAFLRVAATVLDHDTGILAEVLDTVRDMLIEAPTRRIALLFDPADTERGLDELSRRALSSVAKPVNTRRFATPWSRDSGVHLFTLGGKIAGVRIDVVVGRASLLATVRGYRWRRWWNATVEPRLVRQQGLPGVLAVEDAWP